MSSHKESQQLSICKISYTPNGDRGPESKKNYKWLLFSGEPSLLNSTNKRDLFFKVREDLFLDV